MESADGKRLYYFRSDHRDGIWTVPSDGGAEAAVPELKDVKPTRSWTVSAEGIYFAEFGPDGTAAVKLFRFATRKTTTVATPGRPPAGKTPGLDISPDGRNLLYTQADQNIDGLMMIDRFR
jgi:hypothetical protein